MDDSTQPIFDQALKLHEAGDIAEAQRLYRQVLRADGQFAAAWHMAGLAEFQLNRLAEALTSIRRAIEIDPNQAVFHNNLGAVLQATNDWDGAKSHFLQAIQIRPRYADAHSNLGNVLVQQGQLTEAEPQLRMALTREPSHVDSLGRLARLLTRLGRFREALTYFQQLNELRPNDASSLAEMGECLCNLSELDSAAHCYRESLRIEPSRANTRFQLASVLAQQDLFHEAEVELQRACRQAPSETAWPLRQLTFCPVAFPSVDKLDDYRLLLEQALDQLLAQPARFDAEQLATIGFFPPFMLAHQGRSNRAIKEKFANLCRQWIQPLQPVRHKRHGRPRLGVVVTARHEGNFLRSAGEIVARLDPSRFEVILFCAQESVGRLRKRINRPDLHVVGLASGFHNTRCQIADAECDALYYWEIGTDATNYVLPFYRLAPVQFTSWGTQVTTGIQEVDYYVSSELLEPQEAQKLYTERLVLFPGMLTCQLPVAAPPPTKREYFGLPSRGALYVCPQTVMKLHPAQDELFAEVLRRDPEGWLVLNAGRHARPAAILEARLRRQMPDVFERIILLPWQSPKDYLRLVSIADAILDVQHFSAASSSYDMWSLNQPIVTLPGEFNVGRYTLACYQQMEMIDLVAEDRSNYGEIANRLANDVDWRAEIKNTLKERTPRLFHDTNCITELENFVAAAVDRPEAERR